jgi:ABC-type transport system involved in cytochrome c biogenesis permease component
MDSLVLTLVLVLIYMLPWLIAMLRDHHNRSAICVLNLLLGWTALGWIIALVWALTNPPKTLQKEIAI